MKCSLTTFSSNDVRLNTPAKAFENYRIIKKQKHETSIILFVQFTIDDSIRYLESIVQINDDELRVVNNSWRMVSVK